MSASRKGIQWIEPPVLTRGEPSARTDEPMREMREMAAWVATLITELSMCLQMILADAFAPTDLAQSSTRWIERLLALVASIERAAGRNVPNATATHPGDLGPRTLNAKPSEDAPHADSTARHQPAHTSALPAPDQFPLSAELPAARFPTLTQRERQILRLADTVGYPPRQIAAKLHLSVKTVYTHLRNARRKQRARAAARDQRT